MAASTRVRPLTSSVVVLCLLAAAPHAARAATPSEARSLRGLAGVEVVIENLADELRAAGLNADQLLGDVQSRLREHGVRILGQGDRAPGRPWLYLRVAAVRSANVPLVGFYAALQLRQDVSLGRDADLHLGATTWDAGTAGLAGASVLADAVRETVRALAERFATDFEAVNAGR